MLKIDKNDFPCREIARKVCFGYLPQLNQYLTNTYSRIDGQELSVNDFKTCLENLSIKEYDKMLEDGLWDEVENISCMDLC